jgi:hypothetical protein
MNAKKVWTFFYGSYINLSVLKEIGLIPQQYEPAKLNGFEIYIQPRANLIPSNQHCVYGIAALLTHDELTCLYAHTKEKLGEIYLPEAVLIETWEGSFRPALCYIAPHMESRAAEKEYVDRIVNPAHDFGFPDWYIQKLKSFYP